MYSDRPTDRQARSHRNLPLPQLGLITPANPRTASQLQLRSAFTASAGSYDALTQSQQDAWSTAVANYQSRPTLGQSGPLTGFQLFQKLNAILRQLGQDPIGAPSARPNFAPNAPQNLVITNLTGCQP